MWFPRPAEEQAVFLLEPSGTWTAEAVYALLVDPAGVEWRDKVGVGGRAEGSAKPTTRLLATRGWVLKTRMDLELETRRVAYDVECTIRQLRAASLPVRLERRLSTGA